MNKYILKAILCSAAVVATLSSCEFDQYPETSLPTEQSWQTVDDATNFNVGLLAYLRSVAGGSKAYITEVQSDLFNGRTGLASLNRYYNWYFTNSDTEGDIIWSANYGMITAANNIIGNIDKVIENVKAAGEDTQADDLVTLNTYKANAYFARAYGYTNMVTRYCKNYETETASSTLGLPLVTEVDVNARPARSSLADTYALIKSDIAQAKELLTDHDNTDYTAPNYNVVVALDARVSLQMKDYGNAISCAEEIVSKYPLISDQSEYQEMWSNDAGTEIIFEPQQTQDEVANSYSGIFIAYSSSQAAYAPYYIPTQGLMDLYEDGDIRKDVFFMQTTAAANDLVSDGVYIFTKFPGNESLKKDAEDETTFYNMTKAFRVAELYLIAAEASYMRDGNDGGYLRTLRAARGASTENLSGAALLTQIKNEWAREFCGEGFRLDCLKRWNDPCVRMTPQNLTAGFLLTQTNCTELNIPAGDMRFVWEIPSNDLQANPNLQRNWSE